MAKGLPTSGNESGQQLSSEQDNRVIRRRQEDSNNDVPGTPDQGREAQGREGSKLMRQVSHDGFGSIESDRKEAAREQLSGSPVRCVTDFDRVTSQGEFAQNVHDICTANSSNPPTPLRTPLFLSHHIYSIRLEADLHPLQLILYRLMSHAQYNKKGLFNSPVDPIALRLPDYSNVIKKPMDLGTIKKRLHSAEYKSRSSAIEDVRLCFRNAMRYNPPPHYVHMAAEGLLAFFEEQMQDLLPDTVYSTTRHTTASAKVDPVTTQSALPPSAQVQPAELVSAIDTTQSTQDIPSRRHGRKVEMLPGPRPKRRRSTKTFKPTHSCQWCRGRTCSICMQGCLGMEPTLLVCSGQQCAGTRIRKGATYYIAPDGSCQFCHRCFASLPPVLPESSEEPAYRYKRDILKRKNDEEVVEKWVTCSVCHGSVHHVCAFFNPHVHQEDRFICPECSLSGFDGEMCQDAPGATHSFTTGVDNPVSLVELGVCSTMNGERILGADALPETNISSFIQGKLFAVLTKSECPDAAKTITVRVVSDCEREFHIPGIIQHHFELQRSCDAGSLVSPLSSVKYRSKAIVLFQKIDGFDVCIFCMYVHEYDDSEDHRVVGQEKRVYIAYLDSVEYFRPRAARTQVYHEIISAYLATARKRKYTAAHIWACPPSRGNSFVFWSHPAAQRTPNMERLTAWYHSALSRAAACGIVTDVMSLYESDFEHAMTKIASSDSPHTIARMPCPPLLEGDFWVEEAVRVHASALARRSKDLLNNLDSPMSSTGDSQTHSCPALVLSSMIRDKIISLPASLAFRRPVNAAAMGLKNYHTIVRKPMDFSTVYAKCSLGEYESLYSLVEDVELIFANAMKFNPPGHIVHIKANELRDIFIDELNALTRTWCGPLDDTGSHTWTRCGSVSLRLSSTFDLLPLSQHSIDPAPQATTSEQVEAEIVSLPVVDNSQVQDITHGPEAIHSRMAGNNGFELNLTERKTQAKKNKRKNGNAPAYEEPMAKRRRQIWLGEEVAESVRRIRTSIFKCSLVPRGAAESQMFEHYASSFLPDEGQLIVSPVADARQGLLEFSQFRHLEFDTLRRAKYSSSILIYHFHNREAPGLMPSCTSCGIEIQNIRWHKVCKISEQVAKDIGKQKPPTPRVFSNQQELCGNCVGKARRPQDFIPLQVTLSRSERAMQ